MPDAAGILDPRPRTTIVIRWKRSRLLPSGSAISDHQSATSTILI